LARAALAGAEALLGGAHPATASRQALSARIAAATGDLATAEELALRALAMWRGRIDEGLHPEAASALMALAEVRRLQGSLDAARDLAREAVELRQQRLRPGHPHLAEALLELARVELARAERARAASAELPAVIARAREVLRAAGLERHRFMAELEELAASAS
jgi:hypothetical protein